MKLKIILLLLTICIGSKAQNKRIAVDWFMEGTASVVVPTFTEPTRPDSSLALKLNLYELSSMFQERTLSPGGIPLTAVAINTDPIGTILDQSLSTQYMFASGATTIPLLSADGMTFDGTNDRIDLPLSTVYLKPLHATTATWSIRFWIKKGLDGSAKPVMGTQTFSATQNGFYLQLTAANKLRIYIADGVAPAMIDYTTTASLTVAMGATPVQININAPGGSNASSVTIGATTETFTVTGGSSSNATNSLFIGGDGTNFFTGSIARSVEIRSRVLTNQEITDYQSFNPTVVSAQFTPIKQWEINFNDGTRVFSDAGGTTPITDGGFVRVVNNRISVPFGASTGAIVRRMTSSADAASPLWRQAVKNGKSVVEYDGTGNQTLTFSTNAYPELGATSTTFIVCKNDDPTFGSHMLKDGQYITFTGSAYSGNSGATGDAAQPYTVMHSSTGVSGNAKISRADGYNIIAFRRVGPSIDIWSQDLIKYSQPTGFGSFTVTDIGVAYSNGVPNWHLDGMYALYEKYVGYLTDQQVADKINYLKYIYNISGTL
jgi:hypothetical protein